MTKPYNRIAAFAMSLVVIFSVSGCAVNKQDTPADGKLTEVQQSFDDFLTDEFKNSFQSSTVDLHYTLKDAKAYGINDQPPKLGTLDIETLKSYETMNKQSLEELQKFPIKELTPEQQLTYKTIESELIASNAANGKMLYQNICGEITGIQSNLPITLAEYQFYDEQDIKDYLQILTQVEKYFDEAGIFLKAQSDAGFFMSDYGVDAAVNQINNFTKDIDENILITTFSDRLDKLPNLKQADKDKYIAQNKKSVTGSVIPAYTKLAKTLASLKGTCINDEGLFYTENGTEYYETLVRYQTGSVKSVDDLMFDIEAMIQFHLYTMGDIMQRNPKIFDEFDAFTYPERKPEDILKGLQQTITTKFPPLDNLQYHISYVPKALEDTLSPAFYMIPPIDDATSNSIYINNGSTDNASIYTTLAHEGYPGHMYQINYFSSTKPHPIRLTANYPGYSEGWASYVERLAYSWDDTLKGNKDLATLMLINCDLNVLLSCVADIGVNYYGWSLPDLNETLSPYGMDIVSTKELYQRCVNEPTYFLTYGVGYLEMQALRDLAEEELGENFDEIGFHKVILETGPCSFDILGEEVDKYIAGQKKQPVFSTTQPIEPEENNIAA